jgi:hypothetical protein
MPSCTTEMVARQAGGYCSRCQCVGLKPQSEAVKLSSCVALRVGTLKRSSKLGGNSGSKPMSAPCER